jgi:23S rRNA (guanine2445-N2)-methyltransferase / 23S rRNA (guanine2069-N7)-methyltransferase
MGAGDGADSPSLELLASAPRGLADLLARELVALGATDVRERSTNVAFRGTLETAYRACLWSRVANRVWLQLLRFEAADAEQLYRGARELDWTRHLAPGATLACDFSGRHPTITHSHFGALKLKDAICDALRAQAGFRPDVARERPSVRTHVHAHGTSIIVALDLSGESLHRRGYRRSAGEAPLKENVAAGVLIRAGWPALAAAGAPFLDPLCGAGTFVIEAALVAADVAPGLGRDYFGFLGWQGHDAPLWQRLIEEAHARRRAGTAVARDIRGHDRDPTAIAHARANAQRAEIAEQVTFEAQELARAAPSNQGTGHPGLICTNPPYGMRLSDREAAAAVHRELGAVLRARFQGWSAAILTGDPALGLELGIRAHRTHTLWNGAIECRLLRLTVDPGSLRAPGSLARPDAPALKDSPGARMFANRLAKNMKRLRAWAAREAVSCYRLYDADMPEYAFAIDLYHTLDPEQAWLYVQEYAAPADVAADAAQRRRAQALSVLPEVTGVSAERIRQRTRRKVRRGEQYTKLDDREHSHTVQEGGLRFAVNFDDYLDTGLFLDHRMTRARLRAAASGKRFLNLYAYTGTATVYAAAGGATTTTSVDLSRTYLDWARRNLALNDLMSSRHALLQADCRAWLEAAAAAPERYDLIFLDPPTFSNSKRMSGVLDVERDHPALIDACAALLTTAGLIVFSTNSRRFRLEEALLERYQVRDISQASLPPDFERNPRIHRCYEIRARASASRAEH